MQSRLLLKVAVMALLALPALAQTTYQKISSGTGFFINGDGYLITNAHVVRGCESISVLTRRGSQSASLVATDAARDLALLRSASMGGSTPAPLRWNIKELKPDDTVYLVGFPGAAGADGQYQLKKTSISSLTGPPGRPHWIQLRPVAQKGNSGGPVLDSAGNVIGVITGIVQAVETQDASGRERIVAQSDVAIPLSHLQDFLRQNGAAFYESASGLAIHADAFIQTRALDFTVPVRCAQGKVSA